MAKYKVVMLKTIFPDTKLEEEIIKRANADFILCPSEDESTVLQYVADADAIITVYTKVTERVVEAAKKCKLIMRTGVGVDAVDIPAATKRGIYVANVPGFNTDEVADHTLALVLALWRKICILGQKVKEGAWGESLARPIFGLKGQTYGIVGFGNIGRAVAQRVKVFGFNVIATDPFVSPEEAKKLGAELVDFDKLLETSDVISIHASLSKPTHHMFNEKTIGRMKNTAYLVNAARGGLVDQKALYNALKSGKIAGAALDVLEEEPPKANEPLLTLDNVIITPHIAGYSEAAFIELRTRFSREVVRVLEGGKPVNWVNREEMNS